MLWSFLCLSLPLPPFGLSDPYFSRIAAVFFDMAVADIGVDDDDDGVIGDGPIDAVVEWRAGGDQSFGRCLAFGE